MIRRYYPIICLLSILAGCQSPQVSTHIESVNAEYRQLEDYVYCLEEENARLCREVELLQQRAAGTPSTEGRGGLFRRKSKGTPGKGEPGNPVDPPTIELPGSSSPSTPSTPGSRTRSQRPAGAPAGEAPQAPLIELPPPSAKAPSKTIKKTAAEEPLPRPALPPKPVDNKVTHLFLEPQLTGVADFDGQPGADGLVVELQPRNAAEQYVAQAGAISVVVLDPARQGDAARVARWDFDAKAIAQLLKGAQDSPAIKLELPRPAAGPTSQRLKLFVRYETADGRKLQADREILVAPPGQVAAPSARWTPRPAERQRPATGTVEQTAALAPLPAGEANSSVEQADEPSPTPARAKIAPPASLNDDIFADRAPRSAWSPYR